MWVLHGGKPPVTAAAKGAAAAIAAVPLSCCTLLPCIIHVVGIEPVLQGYCRPAMLEMAGDQAKYQRLLLLLLGEAVAVAAGEDGI